MAGASAGTGDGRLTLGKRTSSRMVLELGTLDAGRIEPFSPGQYAAPLEPESQYEIALGQLSRPV